MKQMHIQCLPHLGECNHQAISQFDPPRLCSSFLTPKQALHRLKWSISLASWRKSFPYILQVLSVHINIEEMKKTISYRMRETKCENYGKEKLLSSENIMQNYQATTRRGLKRCPNLVTAITFWKAYNRIPWYSCKCIFTQTKHLVQSSNI